MAKPTLIQTILNRPSRSYASPPDKRYHSNLPETARIAAEAREVTASSKAFPPVLNNHSDYPSSRQRRPSAGAGVNPRSATGSRTHDPSASSSAEELSVPHSPAASSSVPSVVAPPSSSTTLTIPPLLPLKDKRNPDTGIRSNGSRNNVLGLDLLQAPQRPAGASATTAVNQNFLGVPRPGTARSDASYSEDWEEEDSAQDVFFTPNSSPRASVVSEVVIVPVSMSHPATAAVPPTASRQLSRRSLRGQKSSQDQHPPVLLNSSFHPYQQQKVNQGAEKKNEKDVAIGDMNRKTTTSSPLPSPSPPASPPNSKKVYSSGDKSPMPTTTTTTINHNKSNKVGITSTEPSASRTPTLNPTPTPTPAPAPLPVPLSLSTPSSPTRVAVTSTRTPSRSNSLTTKSRLPSDHNQYQQQRSGLVLDSSQNQTTTAKTPAQAQAQGSGRRAVATASVVSTTSSMSSNSLEGHSIVFSDLAAATATTAAAADSPSSDGNGRLSGSTGKNTARSTTTPAGYSPPRRRPTKSHTYNGLGVASTNVSPSPAPPSANTTASSQYQHHRNRDKSQSMMLSMTAVLEAAEEEELYRYGKKRGGGVGSSVWKARQLLRQHENAAAKPVVTAVVPPVAGVAQGVGLDGGFGKGKGKERAEVNMGGGGGMNGRNTTTRGVSFSVASSAKGKGKERERDVSLYTKHQPITSSPLAISAKPLPIRDDTRFLDVPGRVRSPMGLRHRRSRSLGADSGGAVYDRSDSTPFRSTDVGAMASDSSPTPSSSRRIGHSRAHSVSHTQASSSTTTMGGSSGSGSGTVDLSAYPQSSGDHPSNGTAGYTSLVLPRAPPPLTSNNDSSCHALGGEGITFLNQGDGKVDLTKDGLAQTTMASVEVVRGLGGNVPGRRGLMGKIQMQFQLALVRRKTVPAKVVFPSAGVGENEEGECSGEVGGEGGGASVLGFTSYRKPPDYVPSGSVLVQVWAVGVDGVDGRLVGVRMGYGSPSGGAVPPSPTKGEVVLDATTANDAQQQGQTAVAVKDNKMPKLGRAGGLGRSLSLRERLSRSVSLGRSAGRDFVLQQQQKRQQSPEKDSPPSSRIPSQSQSLEKEEKRSVSGGAGTTATATAVPGVGYVPGRSFVGRVVECGWEVREEVVRKGDWVAGLLDVKKCGALTEFLVVDRHRIHRVPHPQISYPRASSTTPLTFSASQTSAPSTLKQHSLTLEELALLPLCGITAYRAVRTFMYAFSSMRDNPSLSSVGGPPDLAKHRPPGLSPHTPMSFSAYGSMVSRLNLGDHENGRRRRALVLKGHDGVGAMAVQMLVLRGWRVCVHVPFIASPPNVPTTSAIADRFMEEVEERIRSWGAEEVIFDDGEVVGCDEGRGAIVRVVDGLREDGDVFDAVLDTVGGKEVREAAERLLRSPGRRVGSDEGTNGKKAVARGMGQFTTVVGDTPERPIPSAGDLFRAGLRSLKFGGGGGGGSSVVNTEKGSSENVSVRSQDGKGGKVGYAWVNISQDVDWEGKGVGETIGSVMELALEYGIKPWVGTEYAIANGLSLSRREIPTPISAEVDSAPRLEPGRWEGSRVVPFEKTPNVFVDGGPLTSGGTVVVKIAT